MQFLELKNTTRKRDCPSTRGFGFEGLEPRYLLAGITFNSTTGVVTVEGSNQADFVQVLPTSPTEITVRYAGVDSQTFVAADVSEVLFFARDGDDWFNNQTSTSTQAFGHGGNDFFLGGSGADLFRGGEGNDRLVGNGGDDNLFGDSGHDSLFAGAGDDRLVGESGNDRLLGESGNDLLICGAGDDVADGGSGQDEIYGNEGNDKLFGGDGDDAMFGQDGDDVMFGLGGNDTLQGNGGRDQLLGGDGDDQIAGGADDDTIFGELGKDSAYGGSGDDWISGGGLDDSLFGDAGRDRIKGDDGNDRIWGGGDDDRISGGAGDDIAVGEFGNDKIWGDSGEDQLFGDQGDDNLDGGTGDDVILGGEGADNLFGQDGQDSLFGNEGDDFLSGGNGDDNLYGHQGRDGIFGGLGNDFILGHEDSDHIRGEAGHDTVFAGDGDDFILGGDGSDRLFGQNGEDRIFGEAGNDILDGGAQRDVLDGGSGDDDIIGSVEDEIHRDNEDNQAAATLPFERPIGLSNRLTVSFAPDGTSVFDQTSKLFSAFSGMFDSQQIQEVILGSFSSWAQHGSLDIGFVEDSGDAFGVPGKSFGDSRFGDVRVGAMPMASDVYAVALGQGDFVTGTWAGDILFNSNATFVDATHFMAVALHEVGHVLGLEHTNDVNSAMHRHSIRTDLSENDIATFQSLYGLRALDSHDDVDDDAVNNDSSQEATEIKFDELNVVPGTYPSIIFGDINDSVDVDFFKVQTPEGYTGPLTFRVVSQGISQLSPSVSLLSENGDLVSKVDADSPFGDVVTISIPTSDEATYFLKVEGGAESPVGSYSIVTTVDGRNTVADTMTMDVATGREFLQLEQKDIAEYFSDPENYLFNDDNHGDDDIGSATELKTEDGYEAFSRYQHNASLLDGQDVDTYKFKSLDFDSSMSYVMNVSVRSVDIGGMIPKATLFDKDGIEIVSEVAVNGHGEYVFQADQIEPNTEYFLSIETDSLLPFVSGNYELTISYSAEPIVFQTWAAGTLDSGTKEYHSLHVAESQVIQFALEADALPGNPNAMVWATIYDQTGSIVYQTATRSGERRTSNTAFFKPGSYTIEIENGIGSNFAGLNYRLVGIDVGGSQGPVFSNPSDSPFVKDETGVYIYPDNVVTEANLVIVGGISSNQDPPPVDNPPTNIFKWYWGFGA